MLIAHKIALDPNNVQATYLKKACGVARFAYNWALAEWRRQYEAWKADNTLPKPSEAALRRQLNAIKRERFPWMLEVTKCAPQMAIIQLGEAFKNFFAGRARYPQFRKKGVHDRFTLTNDQFTVEGCRIRIPNLGLAALSGSTASSAECKACGEEGSGCRRKTAVKPTSVKQEVSFVPVYVGMSKSAGTEAVKKRRQVKL